MKVAVLGAGLLGVTSAWFLRQNGHDVIVLDKEKMLPWNQVSAMVDKYQSVNLSLGESICTNKNLKWLGLREGSASL